VTFFEAFDQLLIAYALPQLRAGWQRERLPLRLRLGVTHGPEMVGSFTAGAAAKETSGRGLEDVAP